MNFSLHPKHWPFDCALADRSIIALAETGEDPSNFIVKVFKAVFEEERDCADERVLAEILRSCGHSSESILAAARSQEIEAAYKANITEALGPAFSAHRATCSTASCSGVRIALSYCRTRCARDAKPFRPPPDYSAAVLATRVCDRSARNEAGFTGL